MRRIPNRDQLDANALLEALEARAARDARLLVGVTAEDIAIPVFTFVFGLARQGGRACVVSLARTDPSFYGLPPDPALRDERAVAEVLHEMGHLATLRALPGPRLPDELRRQHRARGHARVALLRRPAPSASRTGSAARRRCRISFSEPTRVTRQSRGL